MKKSTFFLLFALTAAGFANAEDVTTSGNGVTYTLESLSTTENSGVTKNGKVYTLTNSITIAEGDRFEIESGATMKMGDGVELRIEGTASFAATDRVLVTRADENAAPKGIFMLCGTSDTEFKNIDFEYAGLRNFSSTGLTVANCTFRYNNGKMTTSGALAIGSDGATFNVDNCTFEYNEVPAIGGSAMAANGIEITNCKFIDNNTQNTNKPQVNLTVGGANSASIENCEFTGAQRTNVGAVAVANMAGIAGDNIVWISGNTIRNHRYGIAFYGGMNATVANNQIIDNKYASSAMAGGAGISIYDYGTKPNVTITGNTIEGNLWGITVLGGENVNIGKVDNPDAKDYNPGHNTFKNNGNGGALYDLYNNSALTIYAQGNHWSVDEQTAEKIESVIFHKPDDAKLGEVIYTPAWDGEGSVNEIASEAIRYADGKVYAEGADIQIYTLGGALVARANSVADLSALASGVYVARANGKVLKCVK